MTEIAQKIQMLNGSYGVSNATILTCIVRSVNANDRYALVEPINDNLEPFRAYIMPCVEDGMLIVPSIDSEVKIIFNEFVAPSIFQYSKIDQILFVSGGVPLFMKDGLMSLYGVDNGGIPIAQNVVDKVNRAENKINEIISKWNAFCSSYVPGSPTVTGLPATLATSILTDIAPITQTSDIESTTVKHGSSNTYQ